MSSFVFAGFIDSQIHAAERYKSISRTKARDITNLAEDQACCDISNTGDREDIRTNFINVTLDLHIVSGDSFLNVF